ncbi:MAG: zinc-ribbon domain-containing protein [Kutzneria sp.]|nr:zinc-ribbon domain-containing protein [Kutzneria sp.]
MLIFGTRRYVYQLLTTMLVCNFCRNPAAHVLRRFTTRFTLFFVPLFPVSTSHQLQCALCGATSHLSKDQAQQLVDSQAPRQPGWVHQPR